MIDLFYKVIFEGDLLPNQNQPEVQQKLADLFGVDVAVAGKLFSGKQHKIKSNLDLKQAKKYARALAKLGALCYIEQEIIEHEEPIKPKEGRFTPTGSFDVSAMRAFFEQQEAKKAAEDESARHEIFSLDEFDEQIASAGTQGDESSGVQNVLNAEQITKMLDRR